MILLYHKVDLEPKSRWYVTADAFDRQMAALRAYDVVHLDDYDPANPRHAVVTFDGVYENVWRYAAPILEKWGYPYELFLIGDHVGGDNGFDVGEPLERFADIEMLLEMGRRGARIQWHSASHCRMDGLDEVKLLHELDVPPSLRQPFGDADFRWFAYPHDIGADADPRGKIAQAVERRFAGALAVAAGASTDRYRLNRLTVLEETRLPGSSISIIVANYNYGRFLAEAIDSVLHQTHPPDEILVIDDASTDESRAVLRAFEHRVRVEVNERNLGIVDNFRKAVSLSTGEFVAFLGADNRMRSDYVEKTRAALDADIGAAVAYTDMTIFGPLAELLAIKVGANPSPSGGFFRWGFPDPTLEVVRGIDRTNFIHGSSLFRRSWYERVGGYQKSSGPEDHDLFRRMLRAGGRAVHVPQSLIEYRQHAREQANTVLNLQLRIAALERANKKLHESLTQSGMLSKSVQSLFELSRTSTGVAVRPGTVVQWSEDGLEIEATNNDPGLVIAIPYGGGNWIGIRAIFRFDQDGFAQFFTRTDDEASFRNAFHVIKPIRRGWNFLNLSVQRDAPIRFLRFDISDRPGRMLLQELVLFAV